MIEKRWAKSDERLGRWVKEVEEVKGEVRRIG